MVLEGKELEGQIGTEGMYFVDVTKEGQVMLALGYAKDFGMAKVKTENTIEISLMGLLENLAKKTEAQWDDAIVTQIKQMLGLK